MYSANPLAHILAIVAAVLAIGGYYMSWMYGSTLLASASFSVAAIAIVFATIIFAHQTGRRLESAEKDRHRFENVLAIKLDSFYSKLEETKQELAKQMFALRSRQQEMHAETTEEIERNFRELAGKMLQIENSLAKVKRFLQYEEQL